MKIAARVGVIGSVENPQRTDLFVPSLSATPPRDRSIFFGYGAWH